MSSFCSWLNCDDHLCIPVQSSSVQFLRSPDQFYNTLLQHIGAAKRRVVLSALYLGTDALEQRLVRRLAAAATRAAADRRVSVAILLDFFRAARGAATDGKSSTTMLAPLTANENVEVRLFHTPKLRGLLKNTMSERTNEIFGLQHMKFFVFDDTVLITGANLTDQYFVNRRDRYLLIENCPLLADFFADLFRLIGDNSFRLRPDGTVEFPGGVRSPMHPETGSVAHIQRQIGEAVGQLFAKFKAHVAAHSKKKEIFLKMCSITIVLPVLLAVLTNAQNFDGQGGALNAPLPFGGPINPEQLPQMLHHPNLKSGEDIEAAFQNREGQSQQQQQQQSNNNFNLPPPPPPTFGSNGNNFNGPPNFSQQKRPKFTNGQFTGVRRAQPHLAQQQQKPTQAEMAPCPQPTWQKIMEDNIKANDSTATLNAIQSGFGRAFRNQIFMVLCTTTEEKKRFGQKVQLDIKGDGYCNVEREGVACQAAKLSADSGITLNGLGGFGQGISLEGRK